MIPVPCESSVRRAFTSLAALAPGVTGTTRIGRYLLNHSFMRPGLVATATSTVVALGLARWLL
jgi:anaerobic C4-dicarboxylate transporter